MKRIHKVCHLIKQLENLQNDKIPPKCKECPRWIDTAYGRGTQGCRGIVEEMMNVVRFGNPWGKKYQRSSSYWPKVRSGKPSPLYAGTK